MKASTPFVKIVNNSGMIIQHGDSAFLSPSNLSVVTNLNAFGDDVKFRIKGEPKYAGFVSEKQYILFCVETLFFFST